MQQTLQTALGHFFLLGDVPSDAGTGAYVYSLVALSYIIACLSAFILLQFAAGIRRNTTEKLKFFLHLGGAAAFGVGIWSMHFTGMLAYRMTMEMVYDPFLTGLSLLIAITIAGGILQIMRVRDLGKRDIVAGAFLIGVSICGMHYTGMAAIKIDADLRYIPSLFFLSLAIAVTTSGAALWIVLMPGRSALKTGMLRQGLASLIMGAGICGAHYTGMAAAVFIPWADCRYKADQHFDTLALIVATTGSLVFLCACGINLYSRAVIAGRKAKIMIHRNHDLRRNISRIVFMQLSALLSILLLLYAGSYFYVIQTQVQKEHDVSIIDSLGLQRTLIQRYAREVSEVMEAIDAQDHERIEEERKSAQSIASMIETNFKSFLSGGSITLSSDGVRSIVIEPIPYIPAARALEMAQKKWNVLKTAGERITNDMQITPSTLQEIKRQEKTDLNLENMTDTAVAEQDKAIYDMGQSVTDSLEHALLLQKVSLIASMACFAAIFLYAYFCISRPLGVMYAEIERHRNRLENMVRIQTASLEKAKQEAEEGRNKIAAILNAVADGICAIDMDGYTTAANPAAEALLGYRLEEMKNRPQHELIHHSHHDGTPYPREECNIYKAFMEGIKTFCDSEVFWRKDGTAFPVSYQSTPITTEDGSITGAVVSFHDISRRKKEELALRTAKEEAERLHVQMQEYTDKLEHARLNLMESNNRLQHEKETVKLLTIITDHINQSSGLSQSIQICLDVVCAFSGWPVGHAYLLDEKENRLVPSKIWHVGQEGNFDELKKTSEMFAFAPGVGMVGKTYNTAEPLWRKNILRDPDFLRGKVLEKTDLKSGIWFPVLVKNDVVAVLEFFSLDEQEPDDEFMKTMQGIGIQLGRIIERENIRKAQQEAERANQAKSEFLANMSHELRTPLNSIIGLSRMLVEDMPDGNEQEMAHTVNKSASYLLDIVNDILDLSKIEAGQVILERIPFDFHESVAGVIEAMAPIASAKGVWLTFKYEKDGIPKLIGDPVRMGRILINLVGNAVKFTPQGQVDVLIDYHDRADDKITLRCSVRDTGIGIPEDKISLIFQKFSQADETTTRKFGGTGLGLAITKELVEMMGGEIGVWSKQGEGSTFWFEIPFDTTESSEDAIFEKDPVSPHADRESADRMETSKARILVAEDHEMNQVFIRKLLHRFGFVNFDIVENGRDVIARRKEHPYDLIIMDCHMPEINGYQATKEIRQFERDGGAHTPIVALTADAMLGTRERCLQAGMDDYISKPIDADRFKSLLSRWFLFEDTDTGRKKSGTSRAENLVDFSSLRDYADSEEEMREFCELFLKKTDESILTLQTECTDGENHKWVEVAHQMKGSSGMIGAASLASLCAEAQSMGTARKDEREEKFRAILAVYDKVKTILKEEVLQ